MVEAIPWIINVALIVGIWLVGAKLKRGFLWIGVGELAWVGYALYVEQYALAFICTVFGVMQFNNYRKWSRETDRTKFVAVLRELGFEKWGESEYGADLPFFDYEESDSVAFAGIDFYFNGDGSFRGYRE